MFSVIKRREINARERIGTLNEKLMQEKEKGHFHWKKLKLTRQTVRSVCYTDH